MELADVSLGQGDDAGPGEPDLLEEARDVLEVPRQPVETFGQDDVDAAGSDGGEHGLIPWPQGGGAGDRVVGVDLVNVPALPVRAGTADADLVLDRGVALGIGGIAGIDENASGHGGGSKMESGQSVGAGTPRLRTRKSPRPV